MITDIPNAEIIRQWRMFGGIAHLAIRKARLQGWLRYLTICGRMPKHKGYAVYSNPFTCWRCLRASVK